MIQLEEENAKTQERLADALATISTHNETTARILKETKDFGSRWTYIGVAVASAVLALTLLLVLGVHR